MDVTKGDGSSTSNPSAASGLSLAQVYRQRENERNRRRMAKSKATFGLRYGKLELQPLAKPSELLEEASSKEQQVAAAREGGAVPAGQREGEEGEGGEEEGERRPLQSFYSKLSSLRHKLGSKLSLMGGARSPPAEWERPPELVWDSASGGGPRAGDRPPILKNSPGFSAREAPSIMRKKTVSFKEAERMAVAAGGPAAHCSHSSPADAKRDLARRLANESAESFFSVAAVVTDDSSTSDNDDGDNGDDDNDDHGEKRVAVAVDREGKEDGNDDDSGLDFEYVGRDDST